MSNLPCCPARKCSVRELSPTSGQVYDVLVKQTTPDETVEVDTEYLRNTYATRTGYKVARMTPPP